MNRRYLLLYLCFFASVFVALPCLVSASTKSDYEEQLSQYRRNYAEYLILKKDYQDNPTLDNQQKSILVAKQVLLSRDRAKGYFARFLNSGITSRNLKLDQLLVFQNGLASASAFYDLQVSLAQKIASPSDLTRFSSNYQKTRSEFDNYFYYGVVANKAAQQVQFQLEAKRLLDTLYPKLPNPMPALLQSRMDEISILASEINIQISGLIDSIIISNNSDLETSSLYFESKSKELQSIKQGQLKMINLLIDVDAGYGQNQN